MRARHPAKTPSHQPSPPKPTFERSRRVAQCIPSAENDFQVRRVARLRFQLRHSADVLMRHGLSLPADFAAAKIVIFVAAGRYCGRDSSADLAHAIVQGHAKLRSLS